MAGRDRSTDVGIAGIAPAGRRGDSDPALADTVQPVPNDLAIADTNPDDRDVAEWIGARVGNLRLVGLIGTGATGVVYRAEHTGLGTVHAVKVLDSSLRMDDSWAERFRREAVASSRLRHPNVVQVTDYGTHPTLGTYLVMELVDGSTLAQRLAEHGRLAPAEAYVVARQVAGALGAAHEAGIIHRDLKPENVLLARVSDGPPLVKVVDFGLARAKVLEMGGDRLTRAGEIIGTPHYLAPEQVVGKLDDVTPQVDVYALGVVLFEMLTGRRPIDGASKFEAMLAKVSTPSPRVSRDLPALLDTPVEALLASMLAIAPDERPQGMRAVLTRLDEVFAELLEAAGDGASASPDPARTRVQWLVDAVAEKLPHTPAHALLQALGDPMAAGEETLVLAIWGLIHRPLRDESVRTRAFVDAARQMGYLVRVALADRQENRSWAHCAPLFRSLEELLHQVPEERQQALMLPLKGLVGHPWFARR